MRLIICLFLFLSSVNASEINCKFHSFISEVNGVKTDHEIDEEDHVKYYGEAAKSDTLCIMGFSHNGAWGKLACQNLKKLFKSGSWWKSESRGIQQKIRFVCGISSTIVCITARYQLQLIKRAEIRALSDTVSGVVDCPLLSQLTEVSGVGSELTSDSRNGNGI